ANDLGIVAAAQTDLVILDGAGLRQLAPLGLGIFWAAQQIGEAAVQQGVAIFVAEDARKLRVNALEFAVGGSQVDAFLQRLEELGEAFFIFALVSDVAPQNAKAVLLA